MKRSILRALLLISVLLVAFSSIQITGHAQTRPTLVTYAAKFVCGRAANKLVSPGSYYTNINVHNPSPFNKAVYIKRFAIALPDERPGKISPFFVGSLGPDEAMTIDCDNIYKHTQVAPGTFFEGFALIYALVELDVVPVYTAGHAEVETFHTDRVPPRRLVLPTSNAMIQRLRKAENLQ
ncbi:MAG TPA: hypothetical protein VJU84_02260 [Pyrinomonadaceae bacterium]|nr:hypothetical protein [Pyrinomonadaceae bacterium]